MKVKKVKTTLKDMDGVARAYECKPFHYDECLDLGLELAAVVSGPLGEAFRRLLLGADSSDLALDQEVLGSIASSIGDLPERLIKRKGSQLVARILETTERIGEDDDGPVRQLLRDPDARTDAYSGGNLRESFDAVRWVLMVNYGPFLMGLWDALQPQLPALVGLRGTRQEPQEMSETQDSDPTNSSSKPTEIESSMR